MVTIPGLDECLTELSKFLGDRLITSASSLDQHGRDESSLPPALPDAVAYVGSTEEVSRVMAVCNRHVVPVVPFGAGTSLEGHVLASSGGISLDLSLMSEIVDVRVSDLDVSVLAGTTHRALEERLARDGLFFPIDPGADATLGGMASTGASGTTTVRYGAMRENTLSMKVVLADGQVIDTARRARKSSAGYDLTRLFIGSEGTLGVITELTLRIYGIPQEVRAATCHFPTLSAALEVVIATLQTGIPIARIEFLDPDAVRASNRYSGLSLAEAPMLLVEFHGAPGEIEEQYQDFASIANDQGAIDLRSATDNTERAELWRARHDSFYASLALRPGARAVTTDVCVPISALERCISETKKDIARLGLITTIVGHVGDGNFHVVILIDPDDEEEVARADEMNHRLIDRALAMEGTCTGEHGIGLRKIPFLERELAGAVDVMRAIKRALDPKNILNPGKVFEMHS